MRNPILFADGAVLAALWTVGPLLLSTSLLLPADESSSMEEGAASGAGMHDNATTTAVMAFAEEAAAAASEWKMMPGGRGDDNRLTLASTTGTMASASLAYLAGRALGRRALDRRRRGGLMLPPRLSLLVARRLRCVALLLRDILPRRAACAVLGATASLLLSNWGLGVSSVGGWIAIRFATAFATGAVVAWARDDEGDLAGRGFSGRKDEETEDRGLMEEGRASPPSAKLPGHSDDDEVSLCRQLLESER